MRDFNKKILIVFSFAILGLCCVTVSFSQDDEKNDVFPVPETYRTEGIPVIKKSEVENLFYDSSEIKSNLIWDTDSKNRRLLVTDETNNVYLLSNPSSQPVKLIEKIVPYSVKVNPNGNNFAYTSDQEDEDNYQLYLYDFGAKTSRKLITLSGKDESIDSFIWSKKGNSLFYMRVDYDSKISRLCEFDFNKERCFPVELKGAWSVIQTDNNKIILKHIKSASNQFLYVFNYQLNKLTAIDEEGNSRKSFLIDGQVFWTSEGNRNCKSEPCILTINLKNNHISQLKLTKNLSNIYDMKFSSDGRKLLIQENKDGIDNLRVFDLKKDRIKDEIPPFISGAYVIWNTRWISNTELVYTLENIGKPASIQSYNLETKQITNWTKERLPEKLENKIKSPELIKWKSFDGKEMSGYIVRPKNAINKTPVLVFVHGGPTVLDKPVFNSQDIRLSSTLGLSIIHTNIRGSSGFGKDFMDADNKENRGFAIKDIQSLLDWIERQPDLDSKQIFLRGESYGGFIVLSTALQEPIRIKGVVAEYPLVSVRGYLSQSWIDEAAKNEYGDPKNESLMAQLDALSPINNTNRWNKIPLFLTRGKRDERIPEKDVTDLKTQLQNSGTNLWYIFSTEDGHGFGGKYVFAAMYLFLKNEINKNKEENKK